MNAPAALPAGLPTDAAVDEHLRARQWQLRAKRFLDALIATALLLLLSPLLLLVGTGIRLESRGPALFSQPRWGLHGRRFTCYKFRSMCLNADQINTGTVDVAPRDGKLVKSANDPRVTRLGRILRRTSIDELPQLWNVVKGDMSLVGPRPLVIHMLEPYPEIRDLRCRVRPGITGLWQIYDRVDNTHVSSMLPYDMLYLQRLGLVLDVSILLRTIQVVIRGHGAV